LKEGRERDRGKGEEIKSYSADQLIAGASEHKRLGRDNIHTGKSSDRDGGGRFCEVEVPEFNWVRTPASMGEGYFCVENEPIRLRRKGIS